MDFGAYGYLAPPRNPDAVALAVGHLDGQQRPLRAADGGATDVTRRVRRGLARVRPRCTPASGRSPSSSVRATSSRHASTAGPAGGPARGPGRRSPSSSSRARSPARRARSIPPGCSTRGAVAAGWSIRSRPSSVRRAGTMTSPPGSAAPAAEPACTARYGSTTAYWFGQGSWGGPLAGKCPEKKDKDHGHGKPPKPHEPPPPPDEGADAQLVPVTGTAAAFVPFLPLVAALPIRRRPVRRPPSQALA